MQGIHLLGIVLTVFILMWMVSIFRSKKEGFYSNADDMHNSFNFSQQKSFNQVGVSLRAATKGDALGPPGTNTTSLFGSVIDTIDDNNNLKQEIINPYPVEGSMSGMFATIDKCESNTRAKSYDCSIFDDSTNFASCGICLDTGTDSKGKDATGGLVLTKDDKKSMDNNGAKENDNIMPDYEPTVGTCPTGKFVATKKQCLRLKAQIECSKNSTFNSPTGCSQCYGDKSFSILNQETSGFGSNLITGYGNLFIYGKGVLAYKQNGTSLPSVYSILSLSEPVEISVSGDESDNNVLLKFHKYLDRGLYDPEIIYEPGNIISQNNVKYFMIEGANQPGFSPSRQGDQLWKPFTGSSTGSFIAGYLSDSGRGIDSYFNMDIYQLVIPDTTARRPPISGSFEIDDSSYTKMTTPYGISKLLLNIKPRFVFIDRGSYESTLCKSSPFITKTASATFLDSDPCYKAGKNKPGNYSMECLQKVFLDNGCLDTGKGYPSDTSMTISLLYKNNVAQSINQIADVIYNTSILSSTGRDESGQTVSMTDWSAASEFCTGKKISSPCDADPPSGPLSEDCLIYLWDNQGENGNTGATYFVPPNARSLFNIGWKNRFCTRSGTMSPKYNNGTLNALAIKYWQTKGGVRAVKQGMNEIWMKANDNVLSESQRLNEMNQCYGLTPTSQAPSFVSNWQSPSDTTNFGEAPLQPGTVRPARCLNADGCKDYSQIRPGDSTPACGSRVTVFGKANYGEYNFSIPLGTYRTIEEIYNIPGNNKYTIYGHDGNVSFVFPKSCSLRLTINNGPHFSGPVSYIFTKTCPEPIRSARGACNQIIYNDKWTYAQSIKLEMAPNLGTLHGVFIGGHIAVLGSVLINNETVYYGGDGGYVKMVSNTGNMKYYIGAANDETVRAKYSAEATTQTYPGAYVYKPPT